MVLDKCETLGHSAIQHGPHSNRVYLMKLNKLDLPDIIAQLDDLAIREGYTKLIALVPCSASSLFVNSGYREEASIPGYYQGKTSALFLGKYPDPDRAYPDNADILAETLAIAKNKTKNPTTLGKLPPNLRLKPLGPKHAEEMSAVYRDVFPSYPFPIHNPDYLRETMETHIDYFGIFDSERLIALSSAEMDVENSNVEMTDFATLPSHRRHGFARRLLVVMEAAMLHRGIKTAYTIARAVSPGMNITFAQMAYQYSGTLINNTQISGAIESMNIWHKQIVSTP